MCALLLDIQPGDEVIMPSFTFVSTANAFVLRGGIPVFVDIREDTLNIDETLIEDAITGKTRAIVVVHYAGISCEMDSINTIARHHGIPVIEDAAQAILSLYRDKPLGSLGDLATLSFHETKNIMAGEGGAILINNSAHVANAEIIREKGTDRSRFFRGEVDNYTWQQPGSSFLPGELTAAFLRAQLEHAEEITKARMALWQNYHDLLQPLEQGGLVRRPIVPDECSHNAHIYYVLIADEFDRDTVLAGFRDQGIYPVFHYVPLHSSPAGQRYARSSGSLVHTDKQAGQLIRLPLWVGLKQAQQERIVSILAQLVR
jgi:dTDP-4-amino-4,6-dideoxygalactose transaminase